MRVRGTEGVRNGTCFMWLNVVCPGASLVHVLFKRRGEKFQLVGVFYEAFAKAWRCLDWVWASECTFWEARVVAYCEVSWFD